MSRTIRAGAAALTLALCSAAPAMAQIEGMPLFTNPRFATGIRVHADIGKPTARDPSGADTRVIQGGLGFVLGPVAIDANVGSTKQTIDAAHGCVAAPNVACAASHATISALAQLHLSGGGMQNMSLSAFGGASADLDTADVINNGNSPNKMIHIPLGIAVGLKIPLGLASVNVWGAPRWNMYKFVNCNGACPTAPKGSFGWAVGADMPVFRIISIRASYDSHQIKVGSASTTVNAIGVGVSVGVGGMR